MLSIALLTVILNIIAWNSRAFCDWYVEKVFPIWINTYSRFMSLFPFSVGEMLIIFALILLFGGIISLIVFLIIKKGKRKKILKIYGKTLSWIVVIVCLIQTLNCFILYHCTTFGDRYGIETKEHSVDDLIALGERVSKIANSYADKVHRDEEGRFILTADVNEVSKSAMRSLGEQYPQLDGYYPNPKPVLNSFFMSQQYLMGIYFPFTLEANYNQEMYESNMPETICHELAHLKGFILEDEANFIAYLACINSDNDDFAYSGSIAALKYIRNNISDYGTDEDLNNFYENLNTNILIDWNTSWQYWQDVQEDDSALISSKVVNKVSDVASEASLQMNGVDDGMQSYGRMVDLLLDYYAED